MSERNELLLIKDIIESCEKIERYTANMSRDEFYIDERTIDAVARNFEIIGEAANRLPSAFKLAHPDIDWIRLRGLRNRIVHEYFGIDLQILWEIKIAYLPLMLVRLKALVG